MMVKKLGKVHPDIVKRLMQECKKGYCNPGCKGTMFQNGASFPKGIKGPNSRPLPKLVLNVIKKLRNNIFKGKTSVLDKNFYEKLKKKNVTCAKKRGATSGCTLLFIR
jgi:hypothetical protein